VTAKPLPPLRGAIIAAGDGSRLRAAGLGVPKPLVPVGGVPLLEGALRNFAAAGVDEVTVIVNEAIGPRCLDWARTRVDRPALRFIVKTTASSLESFLRVTGGPEPGPVLVSTVDAWCAAADYARFVAAARRCPADALVLAVTPLVDDEKPLWVDVDPAGRVTAIGGPGGALVTAGLYLVPEPLRRREPPPGLGRLREYLAWLHRTGWPVHAEIIDRVVDVDRAEDIAHAERLALGARS
jgi:NDP-sugar pyrophosphorylase family protein